MLNTKFSSVIAGAAALGALTFGLAGTLATSPAKADVVTTGSAPVNISFSCSGTTTATCPGNSNAFPPAGVTLSATATFSNFVLSGGTLTMDVTITNTSTPLALTDQEFLSSFGFETSPPVATGGSAFTTGATVFTGADTNTNFPSFMMVDVCVFAGPNCPSAGGQGIFPVGSPFGPSSDAFVLTINGFPTTATSVDLGAATTGGPELYDVKFAGNLSSFEFQGSSIPPGPPLVPEPATLALLGTALVALGFSYRLRKSN